MEIDTITVNSVNFIRRLNTLGFSGCDGEAHICVYIPLAEGGCLRIGVTDADVAETIGLWAYKTKELTL